MEDVITVHNAHQIQARMIVEGANGPTSAKADDIINTKGTLVVPDILANAGGVTVSYFEWVQNTQHYSWDEAEIDEKLPRRDGVDLARVDAADHLARLREAGLVRRSRHEAAVHTTYAVSWQDLELARDDEMRPGQPVVELTSGNTGTGLAMSSPVRISSGTTENA